MHTEYKPQLDGLRFFAFLAVVIYHFNLERFWWGAYGLPVFFCLSGFLITHILLTFENNCSPARLLFSFYMRRILRIFPAYYLFLIILFASFNPPYKVELLSFLYNVRLFFVSGYSFFNTLIDGGLTNGIHLWSVSVEEQFYWLYPLLFLLFKGKKRTLFFVIMICISLFLRHFLAANFPQNRSGFLLPICGEYLLWGCFAAHLNHSGKLAERNAAYALSLSIFCGTLLFLILPKTGDIHGFGSVTPHPLQTPLAVTFSVLVWSVFRADGTHAVVKLLRFPPFVYLGKISYGLYLYHLFAQAVFEKAAYRWPAIAQVPIAVGSSILLLVFGMLSWHLWEAPFNRLKSHFPYSDKKTGSVNA